jgi:hypothetical protein
MLSPPFRRHSAARAAARFIPIKAPSFGKIGARTRPLHKALRSSSCLLLGLCCALGAAGRDAPPRTASDTAAALQRAQIDPEQTYRVRDVQLSRGDIRIYLTDGLLSFITPVAGRTLAAVFTTATSDTGDAEVLVLPPQRSERASLASFTGRPNLDEHFSTALFLFSDDTAADLLAQIQEHPVRKAPEAGAELAPKLNPAVQQIVSEVSIRLVGSLLDNHKPADGFLYLDGHSNSAAMKNSPDELSYSMQSTLGLQQTWQSST